MKKSSWRIDDGSRRERGSCRKVVRTADRNGARKSARKVGQVKVWPRRFHEHAETGQGSGPWRQTSRYGEEEPVCCFFYCS